MCVCPSRETRRKRDHSEGEKKRENYGVCPFPGDDVDCSAGFVSEQEVRASRARPRMRFFFCDRDNRILKDPETSSTHPDEFAYLPHLACAH
jgi:hypothetical protein